MYSRRYSSVGTTQYLGEMVKDIVRNFELKISQLTWMDTTTTNYSINKLRNFKFIIGQPNELLNASLVNNYYASLDINHDKFLESYLNVNRFKQRMQFRLLRKSSVESIWLEFAETAVSNAFYSANQNTVCKERGF